MQNFLDRCTALADLYRAIYVESHCRSSGRIDKDPWASLRFFMLYAFERQGRSADYPAAAYDAVGQFTTKRLLPKMAGEVWAVYSELLHQKGLNYANNPLCPNGVEYTRKYKGLPRRAKIAKESAVEVLGEISGCVTSWARDHIRAGQVERAHKTLRRINGINFKIASLFLRDIATLYDLHPSEDREWLQPIDTWIRYVVHRCAGDGALKDWDCGTYVVENASSPERANQGIWYFCARVAWSSRYRVRQCIDNAAALEDAFKWHLDDLRRGGDAAAKFQQNFR